MRIDVTLPDSPSPRIVEVRADKFHPGHVFLAGATAVSLTPDDAVRIAHAVLDVLDGKEQP